MSGFEMFSGTIFNAWLIFSAFALVRIAMSLENINDKMKDKK
jgi:hypothetical protein